MRCFCKIMKDSVFVFGIYHVVILLSFTNKFCCVANPHMAKNETDRQALLEFKNGVIDPLGVLSSWNGSIPFCNWRGVTCGRRHQRVTMLSVWSSKLSGYVSPYIGNLSFLRYLDLGNNSLSQEIPSELGRLSRLQFLYLDNNYFSGEIPDNISLCSNLNIINLRWNKLVGQVPVGIGTLSKLEVLFIHANYLTGEIPLSFGNLSSLQKFSATQNNIVGTVPDTLGQLANLTHIALDDNNLSGVVPPSLFNLSSLIAFQMSFNQFQGALPSTLGITLPNLQILQFGGNLFTGSIPVTISNATNLESISLSKNQLRGSVPTLEKLNRLQRLSLTSNHLGSGGSEDLDFLSSLINATGLKVLGINDNNFGGAFPDVIGNFTMLSHLLLDGNRISGSIPNGIGNLLRLERLELWENQMSGVIPNQIGNLPMLAVLTLSMNKFSGNIPNSLGNLTTLIILYLGRNNFQGSIPPRLGLCQKLQAMDLSRNNLTGTIPPQVLSLSSLVIFLDLSNNHLNGSLPRKVGALKNLGILSLQENMLSGKIPSDLGSCTTLEILQMQGNFFEGNLPSSLSSLKGLKTFDVSRNNLSGTIPDFFQRFDLLYLNLSFNNFEGEVPIQGVFRNATAISVAGNKQLCGGVPELKLPTCSFNATSEGRSSPRLKLILSIVFGVLGVTSLLFVLIFFRYRKKKQEPVLNKSEDLFLKVSYQSILKATDGFSSANLIGQGSFGSVYKGIIDQTETVVAIKVLNLFRRGASKTFMAECEALRSIRHRNLVKVLTACSGVDYRGNDFKALVFEFMSNGSLDNWLHSTSVTREENETPKCLNLLQRLNIANDVADALEYLHNFCDPPIVHCDLKPSNILLDNEMVGHVADFGLAKVLPIEIEVNNSLPNGQSSSIGVRGTIGYTAPEYGMGSEVSTCGDVYSFGMLLLEMFSGKRPTDDMFKDGLNLQNFVKEGLSERSLAEIADPTLTIARDGETSVSNYSSKSSYYEYCLTSVFRIGVACSAELPRDRMSIKDVANELHSVRNKLSEDGRSVINIGFTS